MLYMTTSDDNYAFDFAYPPPDHELYNRLSLQVLERRGHGEWRQLDTSVSTSFSSLRVLVSDKRVPPVSSKRVQAVRRSTPASAMTGYASAGPGASGWTPAPARCSTSWLRSSARGVWECQPDSQLARSTP